jgi:anti-anti-sigma regulatory factor
MSARIEGPLTIACAAQRQAEIRAAIDAGCQALDVGAATECDTAGLQLLVCARRAVRALGGELRLVGQPEAVTEVLRRCGVDFAS